MTEYGKPMSPVGFSMWFSECAKKAGLPEQSSPHGLRKAASRHLAEAGCTAKQIQSITGHMSLGVVATYTAAADQVHQAEGAMNAVQRAEKGTSIV
jgi:site-specific recombinase XerD